jgi:hypothetical protein
MFTLGSGTRTTKIVIQHFGGSIEMHATLVSRQIDRMKLPNQMCRLPPFSAYFTARNSMMARSSVANLILFPVEMGRTCVACLMSIF